MLSSAFLPVEYPSLRNNNHIASLKIDVVLDVPARMEVDVIEQEHHFDPIDLPPNLYSPLGRVRPKAAGQGDCLHHVHSRPDNKKARSKHFSGDEDPRF